MKPSRLFCIAVSLCRQLKTHLADESAANLIMEIIIFAFWGLHSSMGLMQP